MERDDMAHPVHPQPDRGLGPEGGIVQRPNGMYRRRARRTCGALERNYLVRPVRSLNYVVKPFPPLDNA